MKPLEYQMLYGSGEPFAPPFLNWHLTVWRRPSLLLSVRALLEVARALHHARRRATP